MDNSSANSSSSLHQKGTLFIRKQVQKDATRSNSFDQELSEILEDSSDKSILRFNTDLTKIVKGREIIKKVVFPLLKLKDFIDEVSVLKRCITELHTGLKEKDDFIIADVRKTLSPLLASDRKSKNIEKIVTDLTLITGNLTTRDLVSIIRSIYADHKNPMIIEFLKILENESENITLKGSMSTGNYEEIPSFDVFIETIKLEISEYLKKLNFLGISEDHSVISSILVGQWLKDQKSNSYIRLPFFDEMIKKIGNSRRNGKVGQVVLKGPPGTGKTRIFEYLGEKLRRPVKVISMHEYINFYELLIQSTNLSPSKNQIDFIDTIISNYKNLDSKDLIHELEVLFEKNRDKFPAEYELVDFINNIFDSSKYTGALTKKVKLESIKNTDEVSKFVLDSLTYWKNEKIFTLLLNKKEIIEGELLSCISNGQIPLLDEIDKVKEKEVNGILAFLDLETGRSHKIQGTEREIFIPEWFGVYATSNDDLKPSGPLGRRFNSVHFDFLDLENMTLYLVSRIVDNDLSCPFDNRELEQIKDCLVLIDTLINEYHNDESYNFLDFSMRLLDNFINGFIQTKDGIVQKKLEIGNKDTYIYEALKNAFEMQTEDIYGTKSLKSIQLKELGEQKNAVISKIDAKIDKCSSSTIISGTRLSKGVRARVNSVLRKLDLNNILLKLIINDKNDRHLNEEDSKTRILNFSEQISRILDKSDSSLESIMKTKKGKKGKEDSDESRTYEFTSGGVNISLIFDSDAKTLEVTELGGKKIKFACKSINEYMDSSKFIIDQGEELGGFMSITATGKEYAPIEYANLSEIFNAKSKKLQKAIFYNGAIIGTCKGMGSDRENYLYVGEDIVESSSGEINCTLDEKGMFFIIYSDSNKKVVILPTDESEAFGDFSKNLTYAERIETNTPLLTLGLSDFGLPTDGGDMITNVRFDSMYEYLFVEITPEKGAPFINTIKI